MKTPRWTDRKPRYHDSEASKQPGYLAKRFQAFKRLQRMQSAKSNVQPLKKATGK